MHTANSSIHRSAKKMDYSGVLKSQMKYFESIKKQLLADPKYREKFIAIKDKSVIGMGEDELELVEQVQLANPGQVILVKRVTEEGNAVELPSVEVIE
jgi:hypothetical protein